MVEMISAITLPITLVVFLFALFILLPSFYIIFAHLVVPETRLALEGLTWNWNSMNLAK